MASQDESQRQPQGRMLTSLLVLLVAAIALTAVIMHSDQKSAALHSPSGIANGKPVADATASD
jgi:hypothetical protein